MKIGMKQFLGHECLSFSEKYKYSCVTISDEAELYKI